MAIARADILTGHVLDRLAELDAGSVHTVITSPPYWGLRDYRLPPQDWGDWRGSLGLEPTIEMFVDHLVQVFEGVRRVLRSDGIAFINLGDSFAHGNETRRTPEEQAREAVRDAGKGYTAAWQTDRRAGFRDRTATPMPDGLKPLNLCNVPHRFAMAMQAAGWYWRSTIVWAKGVSFCDSYSGSVMPESVNGWRWERCRVLDKSGGRMLSGSAAEMEYGGKSGGIRSENRHGDTTPQWSDCPGCPTCEPHGGYVLRKGSWRPTSAHEYVFMFAKSSRYYCDAEAVREADMGTDHNHRNVVEPIASEVPGAGSHSGIRTAGGRNGSGRNPRNVWTINPQPYPDAHFATYPEALVEPIIKVATSDKGVCPECGAPWARVVETTGEAKQAYYSGADQHGSDNRRMMRHGQFQSESTTLGWRPTCGCEVEPTPATVLDPFAGSGTTLLVARKLGRHSIGIELNDDYAQLARDRIGDYAPLFSPESGSC